MQWTYGQKIKIKKGSSSDGMCEDGSSMAIMLDNRSTAVFIGRRLMVQQKGHVAPKQGKSGIYRGRKEIFQKSLFKRDF